MNESLQSTVRAFILQLAQAQGITKREALTRLIKMLKKMQ